MRFKLDENLHPDAAALLRDHGHDAQTVAQQGLRGIVDAHLSEVCRLERRTLITFDLDFCDVRVYPPREFAGIIGLRLGSQTRGHVLRIIEKLLPILEREPLDGRLWVVDETSIRVYEEPDRPT